MGIGGVLGVALGRLGTALLSVRYGDTRKWWLTNLIAYVFDTKRCVLVVMTYKMLSADCARDVL